MNEFQSVDGVWFGAELALDETNSGNAWLSVERPYTPLVLAFCNVPQASSALGKYWDASSGGNAQGSGENVEQGDVLLEYESPTGEYWGPAPKYMS
jgi:hypothetical protein